MRGAGGTPGGLGTLLLGAALLVAGCYLLLVRVMVTGGSWTLRGYHGFGLSLLPLLLGIGWLFFDGRSLVGWALTGAGALIILLGIVSNLAIYVRPTSLFDTLVTLGLLAVGIGDGALAAGPGAGLGRRASRRVRPGMRRPEAAMPTVGIGTAPLQPDVAAGATGAGERQDVQLRAAAGRAAGAGEPAFDPVLPYLDQQRLVRYRGRMHALLPSRVPVRYCAEPAGDRSSGAGLEAGESARCCA